MKVLHTAPLRSGGITSFVLNVTNRLNSEEIQIFNLCFRNQIEFSEERFVQAGGIKKVIDVDSIRFKPFKMYKKYRELYKLIRNEHIDIFHCDTDTADQVFLAKAAKKAGAKVIYHSHNSETWRKGKIWKWINNYCKRLMLKYVDIYLACSEAAAIYLFPKEIVKAHRYQVITNGIDLDKYLYNEAVRESLRKDNGWEDNLVIGHVGRFNKQKNHVFLLEIFAELLKLRENAILLLIGEGELVDSVKEKAADLGIEKNVIFYGRTSEVYNLMQAMDVFVLPSLYEGLPVAGVEAQASGLPFFMSDVITRELQMTENCVYLKLGNAKKWAIAINRNIDRMPRVNTRKQLEEKGYNINQTVNILKDIYMELSK